VARAGSRFAIIGAGQWVEHDLRRDLYAHLLRLPPAFFQGQRTGDLMSRATNDLTAVRMLAGFGITMLVSTGLTLMGSLAAMWAIDPWLTVVALSPAPLLVLVARRFSDAIEAQSTAAQEQLGALSTKVQESLAGAAIVRAYTMEPVEIERFDRLNAEYRRRSLALARTQSAFWPLMGLGSGIGTLAILWLGGRAVIEGRITLGAFVAFSAYLALLGWPMVALGWTLGHVRRGLAALVRIGEVLDAPPVPDIASGTGATPVGPGPIEFRDVTFAYDGRAPAVAGVSFTVPAGGMTAVVGPTGSGKSTLGALVCRLHEPPAGTVFVGGIDVHDAPRESLRRAIGYVPQEAFLFSRPLRANLSLADEDASVERLATACAIAGFGEDIAAFPGGWDTLVGERGLTLSGGQRQRAALARALLADPPFLVLDDVFAAVDPGKEAEILSGLRRAARGRTTLLMTHRLRAARESDRIVVLDAGQVAEEGSHDELLALGGLYARLWRVQQLETELANE
jgi:ATP-binding cassette subfamily B protein